MTQPVEISRFIKNCSQRPKVRARRRRGKGEAGAREKAAPRIGCTGIPSAGARPLKTPSEGSASAHRRIDARRTPSPLRACPPRRRAAEESPLFRTVAFRQGVTGARPATICRREARSAGLPSPKAAVLAPSRRKGKSLPFGGGQTLRRRGEGRVRACGRRA